MNRLVRCALGEDRIRVADFDRFQFSNQFLQQQLPSSDRLVHLTGLHCDCWSTMATPFTQSRESRRWFALLNEMLCVVSRFGVLVHTGTLDQSFLVRGPVPLELISSKSLIGLEQDTLYEICR